MIKKSVFLGLLTCVTLLINCKKNNNNSLKEVNKKPNVILIMADDQGWGDLSIHGNTNLNTPNIDAIAQNGAAFTNFFVQPVCSPTRAELMTGRYFTRLGVHGTSAGGERMDSNVPTIATILKNNGYKTAAFGKWHNGMQPPYHPNARGFEEFYGFASGHWGNYFSPMLEYNGNLVQGNGFLADDLTDHSIDFMKANRDNPFFIYLPLNTPHSPMQVPNTYWDRFKNKELKMTYQNPEAENIPFTRAALAMVENIDYNVGRVFDAMERLKLEEETIVIYLSDNGPNGWRWNGGLRGRKGSTDEGGVKTPFFIHWKNHIKPGIKVEHIGSAMDIPPTLVSLLGIDDELLDVDGVDLAPLIHNPNTKRKDRIIFNHWEGQTSLRTQQFRLDDENRLYDIIQDPEQRQDISEQFPEIRDSLVLEKDRWLSKYPPLTKSTDNRPFTLGHPEYTFTQLPARDGIAHGKIKRSNCFPNNTFFTNWSNEKDSITWDVNVLEEGKYEVTLYYTLPKESIGSTIHLRQLDNNVSKTIVQAHDPPATGMDDDRVERMESYIKDFKPLILGTVDLDKGRHPFILKATNIGSKGPEVRLLQFKRSN